LLAGFAYERKEIDQSIVLEVVEDLQLTQSKPETIQDSIFILTTPDSITKLSDERTYQPTQSSLRPNLVAFISDLVRRFTGSLARKAGTN
jgi:hypothetical protein